MTNKMWIVTHEDSPVLVVKAESLQGAKERARQGFSEPDAEKFVEKATFQELTLDLLDANTPGEFVISEDCSF